MKLGESAKKAYESSCWAKVTVLVEEHRKCMREIGGRVFMPIVIDGKEEMTQVTPEQQFSWYANQVKQHIKDLMNARIDAFIEIHESIGEAPCDEDVQMLIDDLSPLTKGFAHYMPPIYQSMISPVPEELVKRSYGAYEEEIKTFPAICFSKLNAFVNKARMLKERGLSISGSINNPVNIVNVGRDVNGPIQVGAEASSQAVIVANNLHSEKQFYSYDALWHSLCDLRIAANDLWESPKVANAEKLATQLKITEDQLMRGSIHIEDVHIESLKRLIAEFSDFRVGKIRLIALMDRQISQKPYVRDKQIQEATHMNGQIRDRYLRLLEEIESSFRRQMRG